MYSDIESKKGVLQLMRKLTCFLGRESSVFETYFLVGICVYAISKGFHMYLQIFFSAREARVTSLAL